MQLKADLLVLLSDVDGLYSGPPSDPRSKLIHTYVEKSHRGQITFGDKSRVGRGGMTAKVNSAVYASQAGIPVVITRYASEFHLFSHLDGQILSWNASFNVSFTSFIYELLPVFKSSFSIAEF